MIKNIDPLLLACCSDWVSVFQAVRAMKSCMPTLKEVHFTIDQYNMIFKFGGATLPKPYQWEFYPEDGLHKFSRLEPALDNGVHIVVQLKGYL